MNRITGLTTALLLATSPVALAQTATTPPAPAATQQPGSTAGMDRGYLDQSEVEDRLEERDFSDISLELKDGAFSGTADRWSKEVDVRVDARTGRVMEPNRLTADQVEQKLEDEGYENVSDVREAGDEFTARAERFGEESDLRVSAANGNVLDPRELKGEQIVELLEDEDWSDIKIFEREDDYGNYRAVADKDDDTFLLEIRPINGEIVAERAENERDDG